MARITIKAFTLCCLADFADFCFCVTCVCCFCVACVCVAWVCVACVCVACVCVACVCVDCVAFVSKKMPVQNRKKKNLLCRKDVTNTTADAADADAGYQPGRVYNRRQQLVVIPKETIITSAKLLMAKLH